MTAIIRRREGWLYLAVVMDLHSRMIVGWSMQPALARDIVLSALLMAVWKRKPRGRVIVHSDRGSQYGSDDWDCFCKAHELDPSMSPRGNCWDNAVAESFFSSLEKQRIRKQVYRTRSLARADVFDYIEMFSIDPDATATWAASVPRRSNAPRTATSECPWNRVKSNLCSRSS